MSLECIRCQKCCKQVHIPIRMNLGMKKKTIDFYSLRGIEIVTVGRITYAVMKQTCIFLMDSGCSIYACRPDHCVAYDCSHDKILGNQHPDFEF